jgi:hypothetical protein
MAVGGDIVEIKYSHPTLGDWTFFPKAGEDNSYFPGGVVTQSDANMIDGGGNPIYQKNRQRGYFNVVVANDQNNGQDLEKALAVSGSVLPADWTFSLINGTVYSGSGTAVDPLEGNVNQATFTLRVEGGAFKKIVG